MKATTVLLAPALAVVLAALALAGCDVPDPAPPPRACEAAPPCLSTDRTWTCGLPERPAPGICRFHCTACVGGMTEGWIWRTTADPSICGGEMDAAFVPTPCP